MLLFKSEEMLVCQIIDGTHWVRYSVMSKWFDLLSEKCIRKGSCDRTKERTFL